MSDKFKNKITFSHNFPKGTMYRVVGMSDNNVNSGLGIIVKSVGEAEMSIMSEPLTPMSISNPETPSILSISNFYLSTSTEHSFVEDD